MSRASFVPLAAVALLCSAAAAQPRVWSWHQTAAPTPAYLVPMVRVDMYGPGAIGHSAEHAADLVCDEVLARGLQAGQICILLQNFGRGDGGPNNPHADGPALFWQYSDQLPQEMNGQPVPNYWQTPWKAGGIAEVRLWTSQFIARYKERQLLDGIPPPTRFHFDTEAYITACCSTEAVVAFDFLRQDPRWSSEPVGGNGSNPGPTMEQLYIAAGSPAYDISQPVDASPENRAWYEWYARVASQAVSAAMNEAVFTPIRGAWPACKSSDYGYASTDGQASTKSPPFVARELIDTWQPGTTWLRHAARSFADLDAPACYAVHEDHALPGESLWDASLRVHRFNMESAQHSEPSRTLATTPWITVPGQVVGVSDSGATYTITRDDTRRLLALFRAKAVPEILLWSATPPSTADLDDFGRLVDDVWGSSITAVTINSGTASGNSASLNRSQFDFFSVMPGSSGPSELIVDFATGFQQANTLLVNFEHGKLPPGSSGSVALFNHRSGFWEPILSISPASPRGVVSCVDLRAPAHISATGGVRARIRLNLPLFSASAGQYDLIQLVRLDNRCLADVNKDGLVDGLDISDFMSCHSGEGCLPDMDPDFNCNSVIDDQDLEDFMAVWQSGC